MINRIEELSIQTWDKLKLLDLNLEKVNEEGFTQDLIYTILKSSSSLLVIDPSVKELESQTGADFFWTLSKGGSNERKLAIQAKRASPEKKTRISLYSSLEYKFTTTRMRNKILVGYQHELLKEFCNEENYEPFYIFYNTLFSNSPKSHVDNSKAKKSDIKYDNKVVGQEVFGITISPLTVIEKFVNKNKSNHNFLNLLYESDTLSLPEFLRQCNQTLGNSNFPTNPNDPNGQKNFKYSINSGSTKNDNDSGKRSEDSSSNNDNGSDFRNNNDDSETNLFEEFKSVTKGNLTFLYSNKEINNPKDMITKAEESFYNLRLSVLRNNSRSAINIYNNEIKQWIDYSTHLGTLRDFMDNKGIFLEFENFEPDDIRDYDIEVLRQVVEMFHKVIKESSNSTELDIDIFKNVKRAVLKMQIVLDTKPNYFIRTNIT